MKNLTKTTKLMLTLIATVAFFTIFSAKTDAATIEKIVFDNQYYIASNMDLEQYYGFNDYAGAYEHFNYHGIDEGRAGSPLFNVTYYKEANSDLSGMTNRDAYEHFVYHGIAEGRTASELFNVKYYLDTYPDVKDYCTNEDGEVDYAKAYDHYVFSGIVEGRSPNANLDVDHYIFANADLKATFVKEDGIDYAGAANHYFFHGFSEGRETTHKYDKQTMEDNGDGTHSLVCDSCGLSSEVKEPHEMEGYETTETTHKKHCTKCGFCEEVEEHDFTYGYDQEKNEYTKTCEECGFVGTDEEKHALADAKAEAEAKIDEFVGTLNTTDYSEENMQKILETINESSNKLHDATTPEEAAKVAEEVIEALKAVKSNSQLLADAKAEAEAKIDEFVGTLNTTDYSEENMQKLLDTLNESSNKLHDATTPEEAAKIADEVIEALKAVKSNSQLLADAKAEAEAKIDEYVGSLDTNKYADCMNKILNLINESSNNLYNATTPEEAAKVAEDTIAAIEGVKAEKDLKDAKAEAKKQLDDYMSKLDTTNYTQRNLNKLMDTYNESSNKLFDATTPEEVEGIVEEVLEQLKSVRTNNQVTEAKQDVKDMLDKYMAELDTVEYSKYGLLSEVIDVINEASNKLHDAETVADVEKASDEIIGELEKIEAKKALESVKEDAHNKLEEVYNSKSNTEYTVNRKNLLEAFNEGETNIYKAENEETVQDALKQAIDKLNAILSDKEQKEYDEYQEQLKEAKIKAKNDFTQYICDKLNSEEYNNEELIKFFTSDEEFDKLIDNAETIEEVENILENYKAKIDYEYKTGGLIDVKKECENEMSETIEKYFPPIIGEHSIGFESDLEVEDKQEEYEDKIKDAETIEEAERLKQEFLDWLAKYMKENYDRSI